MIKTFIKIKNCSSRTFVICVLSILFSIPNFNQAKILDVVITSKQVILSGKQFSKYGSYELIKGIIHFGFDPANYSNSRITDLTLAEKNESGLVEGNSNFVILRPIVKPKNNTALIEVSNRGGKFSLRYFNRVSGRNLDPDNPKDFGDGLLMKNGLTLVWLGWQFDIPDNQGLLRMNVPFAKNPDGSEIYGKVRSDWTVDKNISMLRIGHRNHTPYKVARKTSQKNVLTVRIGRDSKRNIIPRTEWSFSKIVDGKVVESDDHIILKGGFKEGNIYELVYVSKNPPIVGMGLAAIRDIISYMKYNENAIFKADHGIAVGVSQTGRFLRKFIYQGFNVDEEYRKAFDGMMIITAGAGRGSFNHRFAQPSRDGHRYSAFFYPTDIFPFTSRNQFDSELKTTDGLTSQTPNKFLPKIFYINTGYEYWGRNASLIHTTPEGNRDIDPLNNERIYQISSGQHYVYRFPPPQKNKIKENIYRGNPIEFKANYRALLIDLVKWVNFNETPPESKYPKIRERTLVSIDKLNYPIIPNFEKPVQTNTAYRVDYGPNWKRGIIDFQPPKLYSTYKNVVPQVDKIGNEIGGIRNFELEVPIGTFLPWNVRSEFKGGKDEMIDFLGTFIPLTVNGEQYDSRPSINKLYENKGDYLEKVTKSIDSLISQRFVLKEDKEFLVSRAEAYWNWILKIK